MTLSAKLLKILTSARPRFLLLTPCCLSPALAIAIAEHTAIDYLNLVLILIGALSAHASVNLFNEYEDFISGLDLVTQRTAFSGGTGMLPGAPELAKSVRAAALACLAITVAIGVYFLRIRGWGILPIGAIGVMLICFYTRSITRRPSLCLVAPGLGFGPLMVGGAYYVLSGQYGASVFAASLIVFFLVGDLLLLNQFPDVQADRQAGRYHLAIAVGRRRTAFVYAGFLAAAYGTLAASVRLSLLPPYSLGGFLTLGLAIPAASLAIRYAEDVERLKPALALNVGVALATPVLIAIGIVV